MITFTFVIDVKSALMVLENILALLNSTDTPFTLREHEATLTSADSARVRGEVLSSGAKAILYKVQDEFCLFVIAADQKIDPKKIKTYFKSIGKKAKKTRFASVDELDERTGLVPGSVPPFGKPILPFTLFIDPTLTANEKISFNAGSLEHSVTMRLDDYIELSKGIVFDFCMEE